MKHFAAHYDGERVVLDEPVCLPVDTPLEVVVPDSGEDAPRLNHSTLLASLPTLQRIWLNPGDAAYDDL